MADGVVDANVVVTAAAELEEYVVVTAAAELEEYVELDEAESVAEVTGVGKVEVSEVVPVVDAAVLVETEFMITVGEGWTLGAQGAASARSAAM